MTGSVTTGNRRDASTAMLDAASNLSIADLIDSKATQLAGKTFLTQPDINYSQTYDKLQQQARAIAQFIASQGVEQGNSVAYAMHNGHCCATVLLGIMYGGYRAVAINLVAGRDVMGYVLAHSQSVLVITQKEYLSDVEEALAGDNYLEEHALLRDDIPDESAADAHLRLAPPVVTADHHQVLQWTEQFGNVPLDRTVTSINDALLMYTSGTTGRPKGVMLSHGNLIAGGRNVVTGHELNANDKALCVLPLYHINGLCVTLFAPLVSGGALVLPQRFSTSAFWSLIDDYLCSWFSVVPTQIAYLLRDADATVDTSTGDATLNTATAVTNAKAIRPHLRFGRSASAPLSPDVHGSFEHRFGVPLIETMGLTETAAQILTNPMPPGQRKLGSPGLPVGDEVIVVNKQCKLVDNGVEGEILVRGDNVMQRYFRNPSASAEALLEDGWLRTGDLGRKDEEGYMFITGRLKELIIKGGENIAPREIDDALYQHADVVEAAAFARPCNDFGQRVEAAVVLKSSSSLSEADLLNGCENRVGKFKCPDRIHFLSELPKGPSGKIQRTRLIDLV